MVGSSDPVADSTPSLGSVNRLSSCRVSITGQNGADNGQALERVKPNRIQGFAGITLPGEDRSSNPVSRSRKVRPGERGNGSPAAGNRHEAPDRPGRQATPHPRSEAEGLHGSEEAGLFWGADSRNGLGEARGAALSTAPYRQRGLSWALSDPPLR